MRFLSLYNLKISNFGLGIACFSLRAKVPSRYMSEENVE